MPSFNVTLPSGQTTSIEAPDERGAILSALGQGQPDLSIIGSFGRGALSMLPLGNQAYAGIASLAQNEPYAQERQELAQEEQQDPLKNPTATVLGKAAGIVAPAIATSGLSAPESIGEAAIQGLEIGGAFGTGNAIDTLASGGTKTQALTDIALGGGLGAITGGATKGLTDAITDGISDLGARRLGERIKAEMIQKSFGLTPMKIANAAMGEKMTPEAFLLDTFEGLKNLPEISQDFWSPTSSVNDKIEILQNLQQKYGSQLGNIIKSVTKAQDQYGTTGQETIADLLNAVRNYKNVDGGDNLLKNLAVKLQAEQSRGNLDFDTLSQYKTQLGRNFKNPLNVLPGSEDAYSILTRNIEKAIDEVSNAPGINKAAFETARNGYHLTARAIPMMMRGAARETTGAGGGALGVLGAVGTAAGHPATAIPAIAHKVADVVAPKLIPNLLLKGAPEGLESAAGQLPRLGAQGSTSQISPSIQTQPNTNQPGLTQYRQLFDSMTQGITDPNMIKKINQNTDYILQQTDPNYAKALSESKEV